MDWLWFALLLLTSLALGVYLIAVRPHIRRKLADALDGKAARVDTFFSGAGLGTDGARLAIYSLFSPPPQVLTSHDIVSFEVREELSKNWRSHPTTKYRLWIGVRGKSDDPTISVFLPSERVARDWVTLIGELLEADDRCDSTSSKVEPSTPPVAASIPPGYYEIAASMRAHGFAATHSGDKKNKPEWIISKALREYLEKDPNRRLSDLEKRPLARFLLTAFDPPPYTVETLRTYLTRAIGELLDERTTKNSSRAPLSKP